MKTKLIKISILIVMIIMLFSNSRVFAVDPFVNPNAFKPVIEEDDSGRFTEKAGEILGVVNVVGVVCSVCVLIILGIKYMIGSVEEKAEYKKTMLGYVIGAFLLFSATTIPNILYNLVEWIDEPPQQEIVDDPLDREFDTYD